jgi:flagellar motor switch protein FliM
MSTGEGEERLTTEELEALSEAFAPPDREQRPSSEVRADQEAVVLKYDLVGASSNQRHDYPALDLIHEAFTELLGTTLKRQTRQDATFQPVRPEILNFSEIYASLPMPSGVFVMEVGGLACNGLFVVDAKLLVNLFDLLVGGKGGTQAVDLLAHRSFTPTERLLIDELMAIFAITVESAWSEVVPVTVSLLRAEVDPRHASVFSPSERVVEFKINVVWGEIEGDIRFVLPMSGLRPFEKRLALTTVSPPLSSDSEWYDALHEAIEEIPTLLTAVLGHTELTVRKILSLEVGTILRLDRDPTGTIDLEVEGIAKYAVNPRLAHGNLAVTVTGPIVDDEQPSSPAMDDSQHSDPLDALEAELNSQDESMSPGDTAGDGDAQEKPQTDSTTTSEAAESASDDPQLGGAP